LVKYKAFVLSRQKKRLCQYTTLLLGEKYSVNGTKQPRYEILFLRNSSNSGLLFSMCTLQMMCAYATKYRLFEWKKYLVCRAGWYSGKFNAVKLCQSSSISGETLKPSSISNEIDGTMSWLDHHKTFYFFFLLSKASWMVLLFLRQKF
jgi:hypothetical protein